MDPHVIFSKFLSTLRKVDESLQNESYVFSQPEGEIRLKPPKNIPVSMIHNHMLNHGFIQCATTEIEDWKWDNGVRLRQEDGQTTIIQKTQVGNAFKFATDTGWKGRVVVSTETSLDERPTTTCSFYRKARRVTFKMHDEIFRVDLTYNSSTVELEIEILDHTVDPSVVMLLVTNICCGQ